MHTTSPAQSESLKAKSLPGVEEVRAGIWAVPIPIIGSRIPYIISYVVRDSTGDLHVIDPGWESDDGWQVFVSALAQIGGSLADVASITISHLHRDHVGMAERMRTESGAVIVMSAIEQAAMHELSTPRIVELRQREVEEWGVPRDRQAEIVRVGDAPRVAHVVIADRVLENGELLDIPGRSIRGLHTPGHTSGHFCFVDEREELLFAGDHVLPTIFSGLGLGAPTRENPLAQYLTSLEALSALDRFEVCPAHGYRFVGLDVRRAAIVDHHCRRNREAAAILASEPDATVWRIAEQLSWSGGWRNFEGFFLRSALVQAAMHRDLIRSGH